MHAGHHLRGVDGGHRLRRVEILRDGLQLLHQLLGQRVVLYVDCRYELVCLLRELQRAALLFTRQRPQLRKVFADRERLGQPLGRALELLLIQQIFVGLDALAHIADRLVRQRVKRADRRRHPHALGKKILGVLSHPQIRVPLGKYGPVKSARHENMLEAALHEKLHDERLELDLRLELRRGFFDLIRLLQRERLGKPRGIRLYARIALHLYLLRPLPRDLLVFGRARRDAARVRGHPQIPLMPLALLIECDVCLFQPRPGVLRLPCAIDGVRERIAKARVDAVVRRAAEQQKSLVDVLCRRVPGRHPVEHRPDDCPVFLVLLGRFLRRTQVFFESRLEHAIVAHIPAPAIPRHDIRAGIQNRDIFS